MLYTYYNLVLCLAALIHAPLSPFALVNSVAVITTFHFPMMVDELVYRKLIDWNHVQPLVFYAGDLLFHWMPYLLALVRVYECGARVQVWHGLVTMAAHFLWALLHHQTLILNHVYVDMPDHLWIGGWTVAALTHLAVPMIAYWIDNT